METNEISDTAKAVLVTIKESRLGTDVHGRFITRDILEHQFGDKRMSKVEAALRDLIVLEYVEIVDDDDDVFKLTPFGASYLSQLNNSANVSYSNINNANIAHHSEASQQTIILSDQTEELREQVAELYNSANERDASKMKRAFGYIADKSIDVAIAIATGRLIK